MLNKIQKAAIKKHRMKRTKDIRKRTFSKISLKKNFFPLLLSSSKYAVIFLRKISHLTTER